MRKQEELTSLRGGRNLHGSSDVGRHGREHGGVHNVRGGDVQRGCVHLKRKREHINHTQNIDITPDLEIFVWGTD